MGFTDLVKTDIEDVAPAKMPKKQTKTALEKGDTVRMCIDVPTEMIDGIDDMIARQQQAIRKAGERRRSISRGAFVRDCVAEYLERHKS